VTSFGGQASWAKMMSPGGKLKALACQLTKEVNKAELPTYYKRTKVALITSSLLMKIILPSMHKLLQNDKLEGLSKEI